MRSLIKWKVLLGLLIALTIALFISLFVELQSNQNKARVIIKELNESVQASQLVNDKLKFLLDSITAESAHLETRVALLGSQKDSLSRGISRSPFSLKSKAGVFNLANVLYMNCGNLVQIDIPTKYLNSKLKYSSDNAIIIETPVPGRIVMFPQHRTVQIVVSNGGTVIQNAEFSNIQNVPVPECQVYQGNQKIDLKQGAMAMTMSSLSVVVEPDINFQNAVPKDARYVTKRWELNITRGSSVILRRVCNSKSVDLRADRSLLKPGDIVHITAMSFVRMTFHDKQTMISTPCGDPLTFPIR